MKRGRRPEVGGQRISNARTDSADLKVGPSRRAGIVLKSVRLLLSFQRSRLVAISLSMTISPIFPWSVRPQVHAPARPIIAIFDALSEGIFVPREKQRAKGPESRAILARRDRLSTLDSRRGIGIPACHGEENEKCKMINAK
jgi:hypothetical protein